MTTSIQTVKDFAKADLDDVLSKMSQKEMIDLLGAPNWWTTTSVPRMNVPHVKMSDGPNGVRGSSHFLPTSANCIPCETALGATFDTELIHKVGGLLARDAKAKGSSLLLAPTCNIQRNPLNGRAFESFSEDPFLSGQLAAAYVNGLQEEGVGATIKHFVCNDMEHERFSVSAQVGERALREIYLMPFMIAQKKAKPWSFMTAYSRINGIHCSENVRLLQGILRGEWGFDGLVMSDWFGTYSTDLAINAGLDLEMPGPSKWRGPLVQALINARKIKESTLEARAKEVLKIVQKASRIDPATVASNTQPEKARTTKEDCALNRRAASEAIVLLKNSENVLPLDPRKLKTVAVIGPNATTRTCSGGGSAYLTSSYVITPLDGITGALEGTSAQVKYLPGCQGHRYTPMLDGWITAENGESGWTARFYNQSFDAKVEPIATLTLPGTRMRINDTKPEGLQDIFWAKTSGYVLAPSTGPFEFGLSVVGRSRLFIDGKLVVDNGIENEQTPGPSFYGTGTIEEIGIVDFEEGKKYHIEVEYTNYRPPVTSTAARSKQPPLMMAAMRLGGGPHIPDTEKAIADAIELAKDSDAVICVIGSNMDWEAEGADREGIELPGKTDELVSRLLAVRPDAVICNQSGSAFGFPWADKATTLLQTWFGGNETGRAIADVVFGKVNPSGRLPLSFPKQIEDCTAHLNNWQAENGVVNYGEGIFVGYRGYEETKRPPAFAFGEGLSYTSFAWSDLKVQGNEGRSADDLSVKVTLKVKNTGSREGADVVQIYVVDKVSSLRRPRKELKGFAKVSLKPKQEQTISVELDKLAFSFYDDDKEAWVVEDGVFEIRACRSSKPDDVCLTTEWIAKKAYEWTGL